MIFSVIVMAVVGKILYDKGYTMEKLIPFVLMAGLVAYFIPIGAIIAWPFKAFFGLVGGILGFIGGVFGTVVGSVGGLVGGLLGGIGGLIGTILGVVFGIIGVVFGIIGGVIGLAFGLVGLIIGLVFLLIIPCAILFLVFKGFHGVSTNDVDRRS